MDCRFVDDLQTNQEKINNFLCLGSGYVGVLTMTVFASQYKNKKFIINDKFKNVIDKWNNSGKILRKSIENINKDDVQSNLPIVEKNFHNLFSNVFNENLFFKNFYSDEEILATDVVFVCVNTPSLYSNKIKTNISIEQIELEIKRGIEHDMRNVFDCLEELCERILQSKNLLSIFKERIIIQKSTVPIETLKLIKDKIFKFFKNNRTRILEIIDAKNSHLLEYFEYDHKIFEYVSKYFKLVNIPEFLAEGSAINNLLCPDRVLLGYIKDDKESYRASLIIKSIYEKWIDKEKIILLDSTSSEMTKIVSNAFLAQRISSINSITGICELYGADINILSQTVGMDSRIGKNYLKASMGFGGSCLKKDTLSLIFFLSSNNLVVEANYWTQVLVLNEFQRLRISEKIKNCSLKRNKTVTIFGLSFKGDTNDVRGSNSIFLISYLLNHNVQIKLYDPLVTKYELENELKMYDNDESQWVNMTYCDFYLDSLIDSSVLVFCNNHSYFNNFEMEKLYLKMNDDACLFDLYDIFCLENMKKIGFKVFKLGVNDLNPNNFINI